jgi:hypothetical protein
MRATSLLVAFLALGSVWHRAAAVDAGGLRSAASFSSFSSSANDRAGRSAASSVRDFLLWPLSQMGDLDGGIDDGEDYHSHAYPLFGSPRATALDDNVLFLFALSGKALERYKKKAANQRRGRRLEEQSSTGGEDEEDAAHEDEAHEMVVHVTYSDICECCLSSSISFDSRAIVQLILSCNDSVRQHSL